MKTKDELRFFIYCRKSSVDDRQASSIGDQLRELMPLVEREGLAVVAEPFTEEKSAKGPGRAVFNDMLRRIERRDADAILCWDIDRLYRNPVDEGRVRWLLQQGIICEIRTPRRRFFPEDAGLLMGVEGGRATDHIITLRRGISRGIRGKLDKGHRPGIAPPGYLNNRHKEQGARDISVDPARFPLVRQAWDLMLTGRYSVREIEQIAIHDLGLRSRKTKKLGDRPYTLSAWYCIFTNPFYYGHFWWRTPGATTRRLYKGAHTPMVSQDEFDRVQLLLGRKGRPVSKHRRFPFTGFIRCGECAGMITAELKYQVICTACKLKFSALHRDDCPRCRTAIAAMAKPTRLHYTYYRCTKRVVRGCSQKPVRSHVLEQQIEGVLTSITVSHDFMDWAIKALRHRTAKEARQGSRVTTSLQSRQQQLKRQLEHVNNIILSPDTDWTLITPDEIKDRKLRLVEELQNAERHLAGSKDAHDQTLELSERTFEFAAHSLHWFREGDMEQKRAIASALGSNLTLQNRILSLDLQEPLQYIAEMRRTVPPVGSGFEPAERHSRNDKSRASVPTIPALCRETNANRTLNGLLRKLLTWFKRNPIGWNPVILTQHTGDTESEKRAKFAA